MSEDESRECNGGVWWIFKVLSEAMIADLILNLEIQLHHIKEVWIMQIHIGINNKILMLKNIMNKKDSKTLMDLTENERNLLMEVGLIMFGKH